MFYFIVNKSGGSGNARKTWAKVVKLMKEKEIEYKAYATEYRGHATEIARKISDFPDTKGYEGSSGTYPFVCR